MSEANLLQRAVRRIARSHYLLERLLIYRNPRKYWNLRGGNRYFQEQENYENRQKRSHWIAAEIEGLSIDSVLEVGCGYGKQVKNLLEKKRMRVFGADFSHSQLLKAKEFIPARIPLVEADGASLPFPDNSFDLVFSSAVVLHNEKRQARRILSEMIRTSRGLILHNEDKNTSSTRFAYNLGAFYRELGFTILKNTQIPVASDPAKTQFLVVQFSATQKQTLTPEKLDAAFRRAATPF